MHNGINCHLGNISTLSRARSRSISPENRDGRVAGGGRAQPRQGKDGAWTGGVAAHRARDLGRGWKVEPVVKIEANQVETIAEIEGPGAIQSIWMTPAGVSNRNAIIRFYWDGQEHPSVECPLGDFFASAYTSSEIFTPLNSAVIAVNPGSAFNCYWTMPFRKSCRITVENRDVDSNLWLYYQINYTLSPVDDDAAYFHAAFRRVNPQPYGKVYTLLDEVEGQGHYVGTYMAWGLNNSGWWGEGEVKFYLDDDLPAGQPIEPLLAEHGGDCFPTICGTGTEDYFCGSYNFENKATRQYEEYSTLYAGVPHIWRPNGVYQSQMRFSMYRWHIPDPIRFDERIVVTVQALGWRSGERYLPLQDDLASVAFWYQTLPSRPLRPLGDSDALEII